MVKSSYDIPESFLMESIQKYFIDSTLYKEYACFGLYSRHWYLNVYVL